MNTSLPFQFEVDSNPTIVKAAVKFSPEEIYDLTNFEANGRQGFSSKSLFNFSFTTLLMSSASDSQVANQTGVGTAEKVKNLRDYVKQVVNGLNMSSDDSVEISYLRGTTLI